MPVTLIPRSWARSTRKASEELPRSKMPTMSMKDQERPAQAAQGEFRRGALAFDRYIFRAQRQRPARPGTPGIRLISTMVWKVASLNVQAAGLGCPHHPQRDQQAQHGPGGIGGAVEAKGQPARLRRRLNRPPAHRAARCGCPCPPGRPSAPGDDLPRYWQSRRTAWSGRRCRTRLPPATCARPTGRRASRRTASAGWRSPRRCLRSGR